MEEPKAAPEAPQEQPQEESSQDQPSQAVPAIGPHTLADRTEEEVEQLRARAESLVKKNPRITKAFFSMVAAVRIYNTALAAITDECLHSKLGEHSAAITTILANSVKGVTAKPFERSTLSQHVQMHVLEFLAMEIALEQKQEQLASRAEREADAAARKERGVHTGCSLVAADNKDIGRDRTVLLVGPKEILDSLCTRAIEEAICSKHSVVRLLDRTKQHTNVSRKDNTNQWYFEMGVNRWVNFAASQRKTSTLLNALSHNMRRNQIDLLVLDDIGQAMEAGSSLSPQVRANGAQRAIRRYADENGVAVLACLPMEQFDLGDKAWDTLEVYTDLRFVRKDSMGYVEMLTRECLIWKVLSKHNLEATDADDNSGVQVQAASGCDEGAGAPDAAEELHEGGNDCCVGG